MFYTTIRALLRLIYRLLFRLEASGTEHVPKDGGVVLCSNHISLLDPPAIGILLKRRIRFMAKAELFNIPLFGAAIKALGAFPVKRGGVGKETIRTAFQLLQDGDIMGIFPEGTRNTDQAAAAKKGAAMIALRSGAAVVPVAIIGSYRLFRKTRVVYGPPIEMSDLLEQKGSDVLEKATDRIMDHINRLKREG
ncbi:1-acyl-sn-glycerol-3-phosphate acyltransferase [Paenibacillus melissococcoides]|uniref:1-acyl-sn-glycerol-3-phosphate acyltransferase n=1 Tax=Paenibacillus melissococcoides TaxID=2912268 RepID=A0ABN8U3T1_9BACL|nr:MULTISPECIES: lysophospholipid acyltransferase family protein [Paenibacillus]MEB9895555.1 lysophospholipid acyltransferase family protein [Bacillus cereus]CAH8245634.1 1-acyl-sn-glycerol-3-phosphate acyltransferase [Paenibacillus melissococcoides]CAH8711531.1 1-acyl-sn-glycerol-3-phosphate acyltransferase [Paenibacillus melissococcoides]CAH8712296.1 1-acyl-sn-glycerol-3-phosphate acyltransferase [Paenibacillus melissococcoides]GIO76970.1 1-acyl-sn-glycerol-3-phosphate acyltransferase [Paeni